MNDAEATAAAEELREKLREMVTPHAPLHPLIAGVLEGKLDPTARSSTNKHGETITAELRSVENALSYHTIEHLFIALTPLGMLCAVLSLLQFLSGEHGRELTAEEEHLTDPWRELAAFRTLPIPGTLSEEAITTQDELARAGWHVERALSAAQEQ